MLESLAFALRHGLDAALLACLLRLMARRTGHEAAARAMGHALALAILASAVGALILEALVEASEQHLQAALGLLTLAATWAARHWMLRASASADVQPEARSTGTEPGLTWGLGLIVLIVTAVAGARMTTFAFVATEPARAPATIAGLALGVALAALLGVAFARMVARLSDELLRRALMIILTALMVGQALEVWQVLAEIGRLPSNPPAMAILALALRAAAPQLLALAFVVVVLGEALAVPTEAVEASSPRVSRGLFLALLVVVGGLLLARPLLDRRALEGPAATMLSIDAGAVRVPLAGLAPDRQHVFEVLVQGRSTRFFVWIDGHEPKVCLDACEACGPVGYAPRGRRLICLNCGAEVYAASLGLSGGCRPIPLEYTMSAGTLTISLAAIETASRAWSVATSGDDRLVPP